MITDGQINLKEYKEFEAVFTLNGYTSRRRAGNLVYLQERVPLGSKFYGVCPNGTIERLRSYENKT